MPHHIGWTEQDEHPHAPIAPTPDDRIRRLIRIGLVVLATVITATTVIAALTGRGNDPSGETPVSVEGLLMTNLTAPLNAAVAVDPGRQLPDDSSSVTEPGDGPAPPYEGIDVPQTGEGVFTIADAATANTPLPPGAVTYTVEVERGLPFAPPTLTQFIDATLQDPRGWATPDRPAIQVDEAPDYRIRFATPTTADKLCAPLDTGGRLSCRNGENVVINAWRWVNGASGYTNLTAYRRYVVNHEFGHALGHGHVDCPAPGELAPVMLQQTLGLQGCQPNPWVEPQQDEEAPQ